MKLIGTECATRIVGVQIRGDIAESGARGQTQVAQREAIPFPGRSRPADVQGFDKTQRVGRPIGQGPEARKTGVDGDGVIGLKSRRKRHIRPAGRARPAGRDGRPMRIGVVVEAGRRPEPTSRRVEVDHDKIAQARAARLQAQGEAARPVSVHVELRPASDDIAKTAVDTARVAGVLACPDHAIPGGRRRRRVDEGERPAARGCRAGGRGGRRRRGR